MNKLTEAEIKALLDVALNTPYGGLFDKIPAVTDAGTKVSPSNFGYFAEKGPAKAYPFTAADKYVPQGDPTTNHKCFTTGYAVALPTWATNTKEALTFEAMLKVSWLMRDDALKNERRPACFLLGAHERFLWRAMHGVEAEPFLLGVPIVWLRRATALLLQSRRD